VERGKEHHSDHLMTLLDARIDVCRRTLHELQEPLSQLNPERMEAYVKLVSILRSLSACNTRTRYPTKEVKELADQLHAIQADLHADATSHEGQTAEEVYSERLRQIQLHDGVRDGDQVVLGLLARCQLWLEIVEEKYVGLIFSYERRLTFLQTRKDR